MNRCRHRDKHYLSNFLTAHEPDPDQPADHDQPVHHDDEELQQGHPTAVQDQPLQPSHPADREPLLDQSTRAADVHEQSAHPTYGDPEPNQPPLHLPDPPELDQDQPRRSTRVCRKRFHCLDVENL